MKNTTSKDIYLDAAKLISKANFWMAGSGHFDVKLDEMAQIIELALNGEEKKLNELYERLSNERL